MTCQHPQRQQDEWFCARCKRRWSTDERPTDCPGELFSGEPEGAAPTPAEVLELAAAQAILGPRLDIWIGRKKLLEVRKHKWEKMATRHERADAMNAARAVLEEFRRAHPEVLAAYLASGVKG